MAVYASGSNQVSALVAQPGSVAEYLLCLSSLFDLNRKHNVKKQITSKEGPFSLSERGLEFIDFVRIIHDATISVFCLPGANRTKAEYNASSVSLSLSSAILLANSKTLFTSFTSRVSGRIQEIKRQ